MGVVVKSTLEQLLEKLDQPATEKTTFEESLRVGGLFSRQIKPQRAWYNHQPIIYQHVQTIAATMDVTILGPLRRRASRNSIISHPQRAQSFYCERNKLTDDTRGIDNFLLAMIRLHDTPEEITSLAAEGTSEEESERIRHQVVEKVSTLFLQRIGLVANGKHKMLDLFELPDETTPYTLIPEVLEKLTPGKKTRAVMSKSYIDTLRTIFETGSMASRYIAGTVKLYERSHNTRTMYADIPFVRKRTSLPSLNEKLEILARKRSDKQSYRSEKEHMATVYGRMEDAEKRDHVASLSSASRIMEFYKGFLLANEALKFLIKTETDSYNTSTKTLRERMVNGIDLILETVRREAERSAKMIIVYQNVKQGLRNGNVDLYRILGANNEVTIYSALETAAEDYLSSDRAEEVHTERGNTRETLFDGIIYDLTFVQRKERFRPDDARTRDEIYEHQTQLHLQDSAFIGKFAARMLDDLRKGNDLEGIKRISGRLNVLLNPRES